jgi:tRNA modification GTPase
MASSTFYALSTISGKSGVAVIRINGPESLQVLRDLGYNKKITPRVATFHKLRSPVDQTILDEALFLYFQGPNSFTGDDIVELHIHGSRAVIKDVLYALSDIPYIRSAEPGEFSKQAFMNGKMDLTQAEALAELIEAETTIQRQVALRQMSGEASSLYGEWRSKIIGILANVEALIDFPGDEIPESTISFVEYQLSSVIKGIEKHISGNNDLSNLSEGIKVVISGPPNAGKSSLINHLAKTEIAIVSDIAGTTRDAIKTKIDLAGFPILLTDTAGIREESTDIIEQKGISIAKREASMADVNIVLIDINIDNTDFINQNTNLFGEKSIILLNKVDLLSESRSEKLKYYNDQLPKCMDIICISISDGYGVERFLNKLKDAIENKYTPSDEPLLTKIRYKEALTECLEHLKLVDPTSPMLDLVTEDLRIAARSIGKITGEVQLEEILDQIFSSFCIGK